MNYNRPLKSDVTSYPLIMITMEGVPSNCNRKAKRSEAGYPPQQFCSIFYFAPVQTRSPAQPPSSPTNLVKYDNAHETIDQDLNLSELYLL